MARGARQGERGVALVMAIVVTLILALLVSAIAQLVVAELQIGRLTLQDATALYLAQAGLEHQIYLLKNNKDAGAIAYTNFPLSPDQAYWYATSMACSLNCVGNPSSRRWSIRALGEIRRYNPDSSYTVDQTRTILAEIDVFFDGDAPNLYRYPTRVIVRRWEEERP